MKKLNVILLCLLLLLQGCIAGVFSKAQLLFYNSVSELEFKNWASQFETQSLYSTLFKMNKWGEENMHWVQDSFNGFLDYPRDPLIMLKRKRGDCDDFSNLFAHGLLYLGYHPVLFGTVYVDSKGKQYGHMVCLVENERGEYYHISNWTSKRVFGPYSTYEEVAQSIAGIYKWTKYIVKNPEGFKVIMTKSNF